MMNWLQKNYQYEFWALHRYIDAIKLVKDSTNELPQEITNLLSHIVVAQRIWISRLTNTPTNLEPWTALAFEEIQKLLLENKKMFEEYFVSENEESLAETIKYQNSKGNWFNTNIVDILNHITHHSAYHRGQLSRLFKSYSIEIPTTDYIYYVRIQS